MWHERAHEHVADPALVRPFGFEASERPRLASECRAVQTTSMQMLADGALGDQDAMAGLQDRGNLHGRPTRQFEAQLTGFLQELWVTTHDAHIGAQWGT